MNYPKNHLSRLTVILQNLSPVKSAKKFLLRKVLKEVKQINRTMTTANQYVIFISLFASSQLLFVIMAPG